MLLLDLVQLSWAISVCCWEWSSCE